ncbi:ubiquitin-protein ligase E3A [Diplogelasinospora grovesii]|uniref:HECT-type E3 ubiquitin transferase n=1 Tax=Diplogelasinospora grovesii TaxID=303347 RepID=A0AAN6N4L8_9PEZI|nr:ubiquitin-protein ligase E3A [Diplogelasinospora grovesii]
MTRDTPRPDGGHGGHSGNNDIDIFAALWEQAEFARLPWDAPNELRELIEAILNPDKIYTVHRAARRHNFQDLIQKQLREGCGAEHCTTSLCFTCLKRSNGRGPIRRYNTTSARILAIFLASRDNAENRLCPNLRPPKTPPAALNSLIFAPRPKPQPTKYGVPLQVSVKGQAVDGLEASHTENRNGPQPGAAAAPQDTTLKVEGKVQKEHQGPGFYIDEHPVSKDYRSFAANLFETVAFKMMEYLTPAALKDMIRQAKEFETEPTPTDDHAVAPEEPQGDSERGVTPTQTEPGASPNRRRSSVDRGQVAKQTSDDGDKAEKRTAEGSHQQQPQHQHQLQQEQQQQQRRAQKISPAARPGGQRRNSNAKVRTPSTQKPKRQVSIDPFPSESLTDDPYSGLLKSPRANAGLADRNSRGIKTTNSTLSRPISQLNSAGFFDDVTLEKMPPPRTADIKLRTGPGQLDGGQDTDPSSPKESVNVSGVSSSRSCSNTSAGVVDQDSESEDEGLLPQALSRLNADIVDFICDVLQEDGTAERHALEPPTITKFHNRYAGQGKPLKRKKYSRGMYSLKMKREWKQFVQQTLFYVLSDPQCAVQSFTKKGQLYDSQTLWYCMLRMTRVAPSLVFHSLWMAAASLFAPPKSLQALRSPTAKLFPKDDKSLSNVEAGQLVSICLHALVAAAPLVNDSRQLYDMSRIRAHGLTLAGSGAVAQQPASLCLQYEDAFTEDLALRLARRLFAAITTRRYYDEMSGLNHENDESKEPDVLEPLFSQLDFLNMDAVYVLDFSFSGRALHETRVPILLLDWARAVLLNDWDGSPEVPGDGSFGGALALIEAMYKKRHELLLGDAQFRSEYFAERIDPVQAPVAWLSYTSTRQKAHMLDFPYIFNPSTLVTYFRSINFSRMSRSFEESASLQERIDFMAGRLSLGGHHRDVLQDLLHTSSSKYLILDVRRTSVIHDAFDQLWRREEREYLRPLKVHLGELEGEEGFDSGGVQLEFFRLAMAEALNPDYGAFTVDERTRMAWFMPGSLEPEWKFELIGLLVSLAVFNGLTLPITFPKALYRKLLGEPVTDLHHIEDGWPDLASGLTTLLEWDEKEGSIEDVFTLTYDFSVSMFGQEVTRKMKLVSPSSRPSSSSSSSSSRGKAASDAETVEEEEQWPQFPKTVWQSSIIPPPHTGNPGPDDESPMVTRDNRNQYVSDYIRYLTDVSVRPQYDAFARGFRTCLHAKSLILLNSNMLQSLVEGVQEIDINELKRHARYVGWDISHRTIKDFWSIIKREYDDNKKRKLLEFVTASDRLPVGGIKNIMFVVQRNGTEDQAAGRLPTAYTCYSTLLLPEYKTKEILRERMAMALENAQGFGFA